MMNKRIIKELAKQAGHISLEPRTFADDLNEIFLQKFAKLIIDECCDLFEGVYTDQQRPERIDRRIKQHFGVEE